MNEKQLEVWTKKIEKLCPGPCPDEVVKMQWGVELRYYKYLNYSRKNGMMWERVSETEYSEFRKRVERNKNLSLSDFL